MGDDEMKVKVLKKCEDKITGEVYNKGAVIELSEERFYAAPKGYLAIKDEADAGTAKKSAPNKD